VTGGAAKRHTRQPHTSAVAKRHSSERVVFTMERTGARERVQRAPSAASRAN